MSPELAAGVIEKELGVEYDWSESVKSADFARVMREYAEKGYQLIMGDAFGAEQIARRVARDYPNIAFVFGSGLGPADPLPEAEVIAIAAGFQRVVVESLVDRVFDAARHPDHDGVRAQQERRERVQPRAVRRRELELCGGRGGDLRANRFAVGRFVFRGCPGGNRDHARRSDRRRAQTRPPRCDRASFARHFFFRSILRL